MERHTNKVEMGGIQLEEEVNIRHGEPNRGVGDTNGCSGKANDGNYGWVKCGTCQANE